jgi:hypothetical protein
MDVVRYFSAGLVAVSPRVISIVRPLDHMSAFLAPEKYFEQHYLTDFAVFGGDMMCGFTLTDSLRPPKRARFHGIGEFVVCQFELNLLSQAIYTHSLSAYPAWRAFSAPFADPRLCFYGHGMGSHLPYSILRFAQQPCAAPDTPPVELSWDMLRSYTAFFFADYLRRFRLADGSAFSEQSFFRAIVPDRDCTACILTPDGWESRHILELIEYEQTMA